MRIRWVGDVLAVLVGMVLLGSLALDGYMLTHGGIFALMDVQRQYPAQATLFMCGAIVLSATLWAWMAGDLVGTLTRSPTRRIVVWLVLVLLLVQVGALAYYLVEYRRRPPTPAQPPGARTPARSGDVLAIASMLSLLGFVSLVAWLTGLPNSVPELLKTRWYIFAALSWVPFEILWVWMLVDAGTMVARMRSQSAITWLVALFLVNVSVWYYYFRQYRPRRTAA